MIQTDIYREQARNKRSTIFIIIVFLLFFTFLGFGFDVFVLRTIDIGIMPEREESMFSERNYRQHRSYYSSDDDRFQFPIGTLIALIGGALMAVWSFQGGAQTVLSSAHAVPADEKDLKQKELINVVEEMSIAAGLPKPEVYIVPDPDPNAFATGTSPNKSYIAVTKGLLDQLNREELQGVVAHEMSHIRNYDIRLMTIVAAFVGSIALLADWSIRTMRYGGVRRRSNRSLGALGIVFLIIWLISIILAPIIAQLMAMAISRKREYLADASAGELTRNPLGLAHALQKLDDASEPTASIKKGVAHMCIVDPVGRSLNSKEGFWAELFGTHPPIKKRIILLQAMSYQQASNVQSR